MFFVVLLSALLQGWSLPKVAEWLGVREHRPPPAPVTLEITSLRDIDGDIVDYLVEPDSLASGRRVRDMAGPGLDVLRDVEQSPGS